MTNTFAVISYPGFNQPVFPHALVMPQFLGYKHCRGRLHCFIKKKKKFLLTFKKQNRESSNFDHFVNTRDAGPSQKPTRIRNIA